MAVAHGVSRMLSWVGIIPAETRENDVQSALIIDLTLVPVAQQRNS